MKIFFVTDAKGEKKEVKGRKVVIPGFEEFGFFVHRGIGREGNSWVVSEEEGGGMIANGKLQKTAIAAAQGLLVKMGEKKFLKCRKDFEERRLKLLREGFPFAMKSSRRGNQWPKMHHECPPALAARRQK